MGLRARDSATGIITYRAGGSKGFSALKLN
jgi:hypothetical protein